MLTLVLICMFVLSVFMKVSRTKSMVHHWNEYRYPMWFMNVTALFELAGVIGMIVSFWIPGILPYSAALFIVLMLGALHAHLFRAKHKPVMALNAFIMLVLPIVVILF
ncbi:DoxX family protein [Bacillus sp. DX4.1]|uniref:DoxX family protein n=1 Tax=Bacillus sp. DX4.1 TaxID=3055867 RepID=UPI0025A18B76|nr:DoxX family protein [Bacillus sp. DX4.1]MDM5191067.1 DoxX family protein [Bacillus sp. DX4.1]